MNEGFLIVNPEIFMAEDDEKSSSVSVDVSDLFMEKTYSTGTTKIYEKELAVYPDIGTPPQTRTSCVDWLIFDKPYCDLRGCGTERVKTCKGWKTETKQYLHTLSLVVYGPDFSRDGILRVIKEAAITAAIMGAISYFTGGSGVSKKLEDEIRKKIVAALGIETIDVELTTGGRWDKWR
ncbi:MAG: hypothetical protein CMK64_11600 [Pseudoalteromonas sp.]|nr:hypothetical protein [Pseudoalteromonas sp.]|tara:strand:- start:1323 stop:1859 length:537 start_codon:yes stop_codon:yes gene_type:complete